MELDLNEEPLDQTHTSVVEFDSIMLDELESVEGHVRNRIRHLEAVTSRARQRQMWPPVHTPIQITTNFAGEGATADAQGEEEGREEQEVVEEGIVESGEGGKGKGAYLIAKALGVEETYKAGGRPGNFFDCNICLDMARDPVLTCCGHLFCWPCFYQVSYAYSKARECPVCKGEVTETGIVPIYGNASASGDCKLKEAGLGVPPRPQAPRIESIRQKLISQGASSSTVVQNLRRFNNLISGMGEQGQLESPNTTTARNNGLLIQSRLQTDNNRRTRSRPITRLLAQGASSFSSLSSALNSAMDSAERLVQDLESYIHSPPHTGGSRQSNRRAVTRNSTSSAAAMNRSESLTQDVAATISVAAASVSPVSRNVDAVAVIGSEIQTTDNNVQMSLLDPSSSNSRRRRRNNVSRQVSSGPRRRRLR